MFRKNVKKKPKRVCAVFAVLFTILFGVGSFFIFKTFGVIDDMSQEYKTYTYHVLVKNDSSYQKIEDIASKTLGYYNDNSEATKKAIEKLALPSYLVEAMTAPTATAPKSKLTDEDKKAIRKMIEDGHTMKFVADSYNVSKMTMSRIVNGRKDRESNSEKGGTQPPFFLFGYSPKRNPHNSRQLHRGFPSGLRLTVWNTTADNFTGAFLVGYG